MIFFFICRTIKLFNVKFWQVLSSSDLNPIPREEPGSITENNIYVNHQQKTICGTAMLSIGCNYDTLGSTVAITIVLLSKMFYLRT